MSALLNFGVSQDELANLTPSEAEYPKPVPGRVAHIDADFLAYQVSAQRADAWPKKTLDDMKHNAIEAATKLMQHAAAESAVCHTTHNSTKGGRPFIAIQKEYQANRKDREPPQFLGAIRAFIASGMTDEISGMNHVDQEADDGMAQAHYSDPDNAIICSADKDLNMVPGWKLDMQDFTISHQEDAFGWIDLKTVGKTKKVTGRGTKFFWAQMLMGDTADNIAGLPRMVNESGKLKSCGPVAAMNALADVTSDKEALKLVLGMYKETQEAGWEYKHWRTGLAVEAKHVFMSEAQLLWMRRNNNGLDFQQWLKETCR